MILRILLVGVILAAGLTYLKQERVLARVGISGRCVPSLPAADAGSEKRRAQWWSCAEGALTGYPSLELKGCHSAGFYGPREIWYCTSPITSPY